MDAPTIEAIGTLTGALNEAVECALAADSDVWTNADAAESTVQKCLRVACAEAHRYDMRVEQVLILMKQLSLHHIDSRLLRPAGEGRSIYERLVTALVLQFYAV